MLDLLSGHIEGYASEYSTDVSLAAHEAKLRGWKWSWKKMESCNMSKAVCWEPPHSSSSPNPKGLTYDSGDPYPDGSLMTPELVMNSDRHFFDNGRKVCFYSFVLIDHWAKLVRERLHIVFINSIRQFLRNYRRVFAFSMKRKINSAINAALKPEVRFSEGYHSDPDCY